MSTTIMNSRLLRKSMQFNGYFSVLSAVICLFFAQNVARLMGLGVEGSSEIISQGVSLLVFATFLLIASSKLTKNRRMAMIISGSIASILDVLWVIGSVYILLNDLVALSTAGKWIIAIIALIVFDFAIFQSLGLERLLKSKKPE